MGHVSGLEKYECVIWRVYITLSQIDDERVWWLWMKGVVGGLHFGSGLMYRLMMRRIFVAMSCIGGERVWFLMDL
jgi:hypothetical protein